MWAFFGSEFWVHFGTGVLCTSACAGVYITQVFVWHQRTHLLHTRCRLCTYVYMHMYMYMHAYVYGYVCASIILLEALRHCCWDFQSVYRCAYTCICILVVCVWMYACMCVIETRYAWISKPDTHEVWYFVFCRCKFSNLEAWQGPETSLRLCLRWINSTGKGLICRNQKCPLSRIVVCLAFRVSSRMLISIFKTKKNLVFFDQMLFYSIHICWVCRWSQYTIATLFAVWRTTIYQCWYSLIFISSMTAAVKDSEHQTIIHLKIMRSYICRSTQHIIVCHNQASTTCNFFENKLINVCRLLIDDCFYYL